MNIQRGALQEGYSPNPFEQGIAPEEDSFVPALPSPTQLETLDERGSNFSPAGSGGHSPTRELSSQPQSKTSPATGATGQYQQAGSGVWAPVIPPAPPVDSQGVAPLRLPAPAIESPEIPSRSQSARPSPGRAVVPASATERSSEKKSWFSRVLAR